MVPWILIGYAVGSVPFAFLLARRAGIDVRVAGSGNVGAANVLRTSGTHLGVTVMALDITKGLAAVLAAHAAAGSMPPAAAAGAAAIVGHIYPVWLRFHGGKGVAVAAGVFAVLAPIATVAAAAVFLCTVWATRVISLGSVAATVTRLDTTTRRLIPSITSRGRNQNRAGPDRLPGSPGNERAHDRVLGLPPAIASSALVSLTCLL